MQVISNKNWAVSTTIAFLVVYYKFNKIKICCANVLPVLGTCCWFILKYLTAKCSSMVPNCDATEQTDLRRRLSSPLCPSTTSSFISKWNIFCKVSAWLWHSIWTHLRADFLFCSQDSWSFRRRRRMRVQKLTAGNLQGTVTEEGEIGHIFRLSNIKGAPLRS